MSMTADRAVHVLHPGDVALAIAGERLETLLGSCVAIVLTDPRRTVGAMCHIVHSIDRQGEGTAFARPALAAMFALLRRRAIDPLQCDAFVYGGGNMFPKIAQARHVGESNVEWAFDVLADHGIRLLGHDVGGTSYRRVGWTVGDGVPSVAAGPAQKDAR